VTIAPPILRFAFLPDGVSPVFTLSLTRLSRQRGRIERAFEREDKSTALIEQREAVFAADRFLPDLI
jgi:hypothetical protein